MTFQTISNDGFRDKTLMVVMPHAWKGGFFRVAALLCNAIDECKVDNSRFRVVLGVPPGYECTERYLLNANVEVVELEYEVIDHADRRFVDEERANHLCDLPLVTPRRTAPFGDTAIVGEVDYYVLLSALFFEGVFVSRKPYAVYVADLIQRYVPAIYSDAGANYKAPPWKMDRNQRAALKEADVVFTTTAQTLNDVLYYAGVRPEKTMQFPMFAMDIAESQSANSAAAEGGSRTVTDIVSKAPFEAASGSYFLWVTNASAHKNHVNAFKALRHYYEALGGKLTCLVCGPVTDMLIPGELKGPYHKAVYEVMEGWPAWNEYVKLLGYISDHTYVSLLRGAKFLWHNVIYDNGSFSIIEAASVGTPVLTSDYPQIRFIDQSFKVGSTFFDPYDPVATANRMLEFERSTQVPRPRRTGEVNKRELDSSLKALLSSLMRSKRSITL